MANNASIARPYAKAIFALASETKAYDAWGNALATIAAISSNPEFASLVNDPNIAKSQVAELLIDLAGKSLPEGGANLVNLVVQNGRTDVLSDVHALFTDLVAKANDLVNAEVVTAKALTKDQLKSLEQALQQRLGLKVNLTEVVDADLIGGAIVKAGDLVIDGSARGRIEKLTNALMR